MRAPLGHTSLKGSWVLFQTEEHWVLLHEREGDDVPDAGAVCEQHHEAVYPDAQAAGGRQPVLERRDEVIVDLNLQQEPGGGGTEKLRTSTRPSSPPSGMTANDLRVHLTLVSCLSASQGNKLPVKTAKQSACQDEAEC